MLLYDTGETNLFHDRIISESRNSAAKQELDEEDYTQAA